MQGDEFTTELIVLNIGTSDIYGGWHYVDFSRQKSGYTVVSAFCMAPPYYKPALCVKLVDANAFRVYCLDGGASIRVMLIWKKNNS